MAVLPTKDTRPHTWEFFRSAGLDQVLLRNAEDLRHLDSLDLKLWVALSCPVRNLTFDERTLGLMDTDGDGRIRVPEVLAAIRWTLPRLRDPDELFEERTALPLEAIHPEGPDGGHLLESAKNILQSLGKDPASGLNPGDTADQVRIFANTHFNGDGIILPEAGKDEFTRGVLQEIVHGTGGVTDRGGKTGVNLAGLDAFFANLQTYVAWWREGEQSSEPGQGVLPLGTDTPAAFQAWQEVHAKIEDYFCRCQLAAYHEGAAVILDDTNKQLQAIADEDLGANREVLKKLPLAAVDGRGELPAAEGLNPAWRASVDRFIQQAATPVLRRTPAVLRHEDWIEISNTLAPYRAWQQSKPAGPADALGIERVREILASPARESIVELIRRDTARAPEMDAIQNVDRLVRYYLHLVPLLRNFLSFSDFYDPDRRASFQHGTLYLDGRSTDLCVLVDNPATHLVLGANSRIYVAYCRLTRSDTATPQFIASCLTNGGSQDIQVGRNGVFYDRRGRDWDATIVNISENPISLREAAWTPYRRFGKFISDQIEKWASTREQSVDQAVNTRIGELATTTPPSGPPPPSPAPAPTSGSNAGNFNTIGILAAVGLAIGAIGTAVATAVNTFFDLEWWQIPLAVLALLLLISGPPIILAWLKLRKRTLGSILDACGWAINGKVRITFPLGRRLTRLAVIPPGSTRDYQDPYANPSARRPFVIVLLATLVFAIGYWCS